MRVALISIHETVPHEAEPRLRAMLPVAGRSVAQWQVDMALALGCRRILCLTTAISSDIIALQHGVEAEAAEFHLIANKSRLAALVRATDELLVLTDGLLPLAREGRDVLAESLAEQRPCVLTLPIEPALSAGMERMDMNHGWAGAMVVPGRVVERLFDLPDDVDIPSSLMRCALQAGAKMRLLPDSVLLEQRWIVVRHNEDAHACEKAWLHREAQRAPGFEPSRWTASRLMLRFGSAVLQRGITPLHMILGAMVTAVMGVGLAAMVDLAVGLLLFTLAILAGETAIALGRMARSSENDAGPWPARTAAVFDGLLVTILTAGMSGTAISYQLLFLPLVFVGLVRLLDHDSGSPVLALATDRALACLSLAALSLVAGPGMALRLAILVLLMVGLVVRAARPKLTPA